MILSTVIYLRVRNRNRTSQVILVASKFGRHRTSAAISFFPGEYLKVSCSSLTLKMKRASLIYTKNWLGGNDFRQNSLGICRNKTSIFPQSLVLSCLIKLSILATPVQGPNVAQNMATTTVTASSH